MSEIEVDPYDLTDDQSDEVTRLAERDLLARAYDPEAFEDHPIEQRSHVAAIQWAARRHLAIEAADRLMPWLAEHDRQVAEKVAAFIEGGDERTRERTVAAIREYFGLTPLDLTTEDGFERYMAGEPIVLEPNGQDTGGES